MAVQVFVSSTWLDLQPERKAVEVVIQNLEETKLIGMEYFGSRDENTQRVSLDEMDRCQIYVGIIGGRYGSGITEDEYRRARELERPCLLYFKHEEQIPPDGRDKEPEKARKLAALKAELERNHTIPRFSTPDELARMVATDLHRQLGHPTGRKSEELWQNYRQRLSENVGKVRLLGEAESRELQKVFVEFSISEEYQRPSARKEYLGFMDAALRERRSLFRSESFGEQEKEKRMIRPDELLREATRAVITGAPGCGKSTLLRWLVGKAVNNAHRLPVFLELKSINRKLFDDCRGSLVELLFEQSIAPLLHFDHPSERERLKAEFTTQLAKHQVAVFLDGLDEVRNAEFFRPLCDAINHFIGSEYGRNPLIISTRRYALDVRFQDAKEMEIAPLNPRQVAEFLRHYYGNYPQLDVNTLIRKLQRRELSEMIRVPVLLGALVRRYREKGELTGNRLKLYEGLVRDLAVMVDREKNVSRYSFSDREGRRNLEFLERIAFKKLFAEQLKNDAERLTFDGGWILEEAKEFCAGTKIDPYDFAADVKATPLLREVAEEVWAFSHLTIQEYLAARVIVGRSDCEQIVCRAYFNPTLVEMEALPMALGMAKKTDELYRAIGLLPESLNFAGLRLRARVLVYGAGIFDDLCEQLTDRLIDFVSGTHVEETGYSNVIIRSFSGINGHHSDHLGERVGLLFKSEESFMRVSAASALGEIGGEAAVAALEALEEIKFELLAKGLLSAISNENSFVRRKTAQVIGYYSDRPAREELKRLVISDPDPEIRQVATDSLVRLRWKARYFSQIADVDDDPAKF